VLLDIGVDLPLSVERHIIAVLDTRDGTADTLVLLV